MKYILVLIGLLCGLSASFGQQSANLSGKIIDRDDDNSEVMLAELTLKKNGVIVANTQSDFNGNYNFSKLEGGFYDIEVMYIGLPHLTIKSIRVNPNSSKSLDIAFPEEGADALPDSIWSYDRKQIIFIDDDMINTIKMPRHEPISLSGFAWDEENDKPITGARIYLFSPKDIGHKAVSDSNGLYQFDKIIPDYNFTLYVEHEDFPLLKVYKLHLLPHKSSEYDIYFPPKNDKSYHKDGIILFANPPFYRD
jgi:hypothetical protein